MNIEQAITRSLLRSQAEAVALNLPQELADDIYIGIVASDTESWDDRTFIDWTILTEQKYSLSWKQWKDLYRAISIIMSEFGEKLVDTGGPPF